jgi:homoserine dehydrogenase
MNPINVGILGFGTVGTGVAKLLVKNQDVISQRVGTKIALKTIADIDMTTDRGITLDPGILINDADLAINDPEIDIIVETIGGEGIAKELILKALNNGKPVITANKALIAKHGNDLITAATQKGVDLCFEAAVGGCMPIIKTLRESLVGNHIHEMIGILNGTCNYILSKITDEGIAFKTALTQAQAEGYAEADPTLDVEGLDAAHKLAILSSLAYGMHINFDDIYIEGISKITPLDIAFAKEFGYQIKLLAISKIKSNKVEARVHPTMIPENSILASVKGTLNAIMVTGDAVGNILLSGHGAGMMPTASAIVSDLADVGRNLIHGVSGRVPVLSYQPETITGIPILPMTEIVTNYYFRFAALDRPGVLSKIAGILGDHEISIKSVHQKGRKDNGTVPVVMLTHNAHEADMKQAIDKISALDMVEGDPVVIRIED